MLFIDCSLAFNTIVPCNLVLRVKRALSEQSKFRQRDVTIGDHPH